MEEKEKQPVNKFTWKKGEVEKYKKKPKKVEK